MQLKVHVGQRLYHHRWMFLQVSTDWRLPNPGGFWKFSDGSSGGLTLKPKDVAAASQLSRWLPVSREPLGWPSYVFRVIPEATAEYLLSQDLL